MAIYDISQDDLAKFIGKSRKYVNQCCTGTRKPSLSACEEMADVFNVSVSEFIRWAEGKPESVAGDV